MGQYEQQDGPSYLTNGMYNTAYRTDDVQVIHSNSVYDNTENSSTLQDSFTMIEDMIE